MKVTAVLTPAAYSIVYAEAQKRASAKRTDWTPGAIVSEALVATLDLSASGGALGTSTITAELTLNAYVALHTEIARRQATGRTDCAVGDVLSDVLVASKAAPKKRAYRKLGVRGVSAQGRKFVARLTHGAEQAHLGTFDTVEEARATVTDCEAMLARLLAGEPATDPETRFAERSVAVIKARARTEAFAAKLMSASARP